MVFLLVGRRFNLVTCGTKRVVNRLITVIRRRNSPVDVLTFTFYWIGHCCLLALFKHPRFKRLHRVLKITEQLTADLTALIFHRSHRYSFHGISMVFVFLPLLLFINPSWIFFAFQSIPAIIYRISGQCWFPIESNILLFNPYLNYGVLIRLRNFKQFHCVNGSKNSGECCVQT